MFALRGSRLQQRTLSFRREGVEFLFLSGIHCSSLYKRQASLYLVEITLQGVCAIVTPGQGVA